MSENQKLIHREISWLYFNARVLQEAGDARVPLIERMRFLGIFSNNLDEFFRVRVATLRRLQKLEKRNSIELNFPVQQLLNQIQDIVIRQQEKFQIHYQSILKELTKKNIHIIDENALNTKQQSFLSVYYKDIVEPLLVPIMLRNVPKFPYLKDNSIYLFVAFSSKETSKKQYSLIEIPTAQLSRFVEVPSFGKRKYIIYLDDVIRFCLPQVFAIFNPENIESYIIKITRDAELDLDDDISESFYDKLKKSVERRKKGDPVRFIHDDRLPVKYLTYLLKRMNLKEEDNVIGGGRYHNFKDFIRFPNVGEAKLVYPRKPVLSHIGLQHSNSILNVMSHKDILLHFPYQNFDYVIDMLREAAIDPLVKSIKISLYRVASDSKIVNALINAARNGKEVLAVVELQARFDEEANLTWSKLLTDEGVTILFGISGLKVHAKMIHIVREEKGEDRDYAYISTGNFHEGTAKIYSDVSLLTSSRELAREVGMVFNFIERPYIPLKLKHLLLSPIYMRDQLSDLIRFEMDQAMVGHKAYIRIKLNSLLDESMIQLMYEASSCGVKIDLNVRGICALIPGVKGLSENIRAISIVDKYLEHTRIFIFHHGGENLTFISSADWMQRNLDMRVEIAAPIYDQDLKAELSDFFNLQWNDNQKARIFDAGNSDKHVKSSGMAVRSQEDFYTYLEKKGKKG